MSRLRISSDSFVGEGLLQLLLAASLSTSLLALPFSFIGRGAAWAGWCLFALSLVAFPLFIIGFSFLLGSVHAASPLAAVGGVALWLGPAALVSWGIYAWYHPRKS